MKSKMDRAWSISLIVVGIATTMFRPRLASAIPSTETSEFFMKK